MYRIAFNDFHEQRLVDSLLVKHLSADDSKGLLKDYVTTDPFVPRCLRFAHFIAVGEYIIKFQQGSCGAGSNGKQADDRDGVIRDRCVLVGSQDEPF